ncbi:unnamed protein product [Prorocentrum cordatum]|uniref:Ankyrin repeat domain-containing protein n=1 Tax=Prorocentrum cordatum TaxID=2364126 RepID=A0ABN9TFQ3_9DINO|nr:unnamed protein product [Polarella glacialis]
MCGSSARSTACCTPKAAPRSCNILFSCEPIDIEPADAILMTPAARELQPLTGQRAPRDAPPPVEKQAVTALVRALRADSLELAAEALEFDANAVQSLFFDTNFQTALNCAIEEHCCPDMIRLLLAHGADPATLDRWGRTALTALSATRCSTIITWSEGMGYPDYEPSPDACLRDLAREHRAWALRVAAALLDAGADPDLPDESGRLPAEVAEAAGNRWLARYWACCREARACAVLRQGAAAPPHQGGALSRLMPAVVQEITEFLLPAGGSAR